MGNILKHLRTIHQHRKIVRKECIACGIPWQGFIHDLSKYSPTEFIESIKYFQGTSSPIDAAKKDKGYSEAWLHHKGHNKHHWEYWSDTDSQGEIICVPIPYRYVLEMICDWISAGQVYNKGNWKPADLIDYYFKVRPGRHFHPRTEILILYLLKRLQDYGLDDFHKIARSHQCYEDFGI